MENEYERAKIAIGKYFCFTEMQAEDLRRRGEELMDETDIRCLIDVAIAPLRYRELRKKDITREALTAKIAAARATGIDALRTPLGVTLPIEIQRLCKELGCILEYTGYVESAQDIVLISPEVHIKYQILHFKDLFNCFVPVAKVLFTPPH